MLRVDLRDLQRGPVETDGRLEPDDPAFEGLDLALMGSVLVHGRLQATGPGEYFWRARLEGTVRLHCRRCLAEVRHRVDEDLSLLFSEDPEAGEDPSVYLLPPHAATLDLSEAVREELALAVPAYLLCREDCAGLCPRCGGDRNTGGCRCAPVEPL